MSAPSYGYETWRGAVIAATNAATRFGVKYRVARTMLDGRAWWRAFPIDDDN